jgi:mannitol/fructose-specific phosphotransferase system IIA component (Ntr-type)
VAGIDAFAARLEAEDTTSAITQLASLLSHHAADGLGALLAAEALVRESQSPTWLGNGVAVPHCRTRQVRRVCIAAAVPERAIDWNGEGGMAKLIFFVAVPSSAIDEYLGLMRGFAHLFRKGDAADELARCADLESFRATLAARLARLPATQR